MAAWLKLETHRPVEQFPDSRDFQTGLAGVDVIPSYNFLLSNIHFLVGFEIIALHRNWRLVGNAECNYVMGDIGGYVPY